MVSSNNFSDYKYLRDERLWRISEVNAGYVRHFIISKRSAGVKVSTINNYVKCIVIFLQMLGKEDMKAASRDEILSVVIDLENRYNPNTLQFSIICIRMFLSEYYPEEEVDKLVPKRKCSRQNDLESTDYITVDDVMNMRKYAESRGDVRYMALIMLLYGTGARISEILDCNIRDVEIKQMNGVLHVNGKTGKRKIPFVTGLPEIITWLNSHPLREDKDSPLFVTYNTRGNSFKRLSYVTVSQYFRSMKYKGIVSEGVKCNPHAFRHLSATTMVKKLSPKEMNAYYGWSSNSNTVMTYLHTSDKDLEKSLLGANGIENIEEKPASSTFIQCPSCNTILPAGSLQCPKCRMILDPVLAVKVSQITDDMKRKDVLKEYLDE